MFKDKPGNESKTKLQVKYIIAKLGYLSDQTKAFKFVPKFRKLFFAIIFYFM